MENYTKMSLSAELRDTRYPNSKKALIYGFPVSCGTVRITPEWFILRESSDPKLAYGKWFKRICRITTCVMGVAFGVIIVVIEIMTDTFGRLWWAYLLIISITFLAYHFNLYYWLKVGHLRVYAGPGNADIVRSNIKKVIFSNGIPLLWPSSIVIHYKDDKSRNRRLPIVVEGSFHDKNSKAAMALSVLTDLKLWSQNG